MTRNTELHFSQTPQINIKRSKFERSCSHKTSFNAGDMIPVYWEDVLPGDTVQMDMAELVRMATPIYPIMDNMYMDVMFFFVPNRLIYDHWAEFWGENDDPWTQQTAYEIPTITPPSGGWTEGTIADYLGVPTKVDLYKKPIALPFRAYCKIWNDYMRDENLKSAAHIYTDDTNRTGLNGTEVGYSYVTGAELGGAPLKMAKFHDYFTSALPDLQKGPAITIPLGTSANVVTGDATGRTTTGHALAWKYTDGTAIGGYANIINGNVGGVDRIQAETAYTPTGTYKKDVEPINLFADLTDATAATINQLRTAFAIQKYYEAAGRNGTRLIEMIRSVFGVTSSDARLQRAEYLGGTRVPLNIDQILQTSATDAVSPQGNTAGFSCTINRDSLFTKSFEEHGILMGIICVRTDHTYQQGLEKKFTRTKWTQYYNPYFANLSEEAIEVGEIYADGTSAEEDAFGYQERWADYRYGINRVSGYMRSNATGSLDVWHFADDYASQPYLSSEWIDEPVTNVDRTIAVTSQLTHQYIGDFFFKTYWTRPMPVYSVPGLIDHV